MINTMNKSVKIAVTLLTMICGPYSLAASTTAGTGKILVRVEDGVEARCINASQDKITMVLRRFIVQKEADVFKQDKSAALVVRTTLSGDDNGIERQVTFPRLFTTTVQKYDKGLISIPLEERIFVNFPLKSSETSFNSAEIAFNVLSKKEKGPFGIALTGLGDITKKLPIPMNPFSPAFSFFVDYSNTVLDASIQKNNNVGQNSDEGKVVFIFSSNGTCVGEQEKTGTIVVLSSSSLPGAVNINEENCYKAILKPTFNLKFAPSKGAACESIAESNFKLVQNAYYSFYLNAEPKTVVSSKVEEAKTVILPNVAAVVPGLSQADVLKFIKTSYGEEGLNGKQLDVITDNVKASLSDESTIKNATKHAPENGNPQSGQEVTITTTVEKSQAMDVAESIKRCFANEESAKCINN